MRSRRNRVLAALIATAALVVPAGEAMAAADNARPVKVMTRNLYLGADLNGPVRAALAAGSDPQAIFVAFANANAALWHTVQATDFPSRAELLADEIDESEPDLIGLQEVALWRSGPLELDPAAFAVPNATTVEYDFLEILLDELAERGQNYTVVTNTQEADVEGPSFIGIPGVTPLQEAADRRLTMRDVILRRSDVRVLDSGTANYDNNFQLPIGGRTFKFTRGYGWADVVANKREFRFVNTHLESELSFFALLQAQELAAETTSPDTPTVVVCDCNSDPENGSIKPTEPVPTPHWAAYRFLTGPAGFWDEWLLAQPSRRGDTSGLNEFVNDDDLSSIDHRIDLVLGRRADGKKIPASRAWIVGDEARTADGLWASDHMGVVAALKP